MSFFLGPCRPHFWASSASYFDMLCKITAKLFKRKKRRPILLSTWEEVARSFQCRNRHHASRRSTSARCLLDDFAPLCTWLSGSPHKDVSTVAVWCHVGKTGPVLEAAARGGSCEGSEVPALPKTTCHKGAALGRLGFCRLGYWHWKDVSSMVGWRRCHGFLKYLGVKDGSSEARSIKNMDRHASNLQET